MAADASTANTETVRLFFEGDRSVDRLELFAPDWGLVDHIWEHLDEVATWNSWGGA
jgi:hypothetical protein